MARPNLLQVLLFGCLLGIPVVSAGGEAMAHIIS